MRARTDRDRLAVWTYEEAGEQIPQGDPSATDAERAAAGRETLAERFEALLPVNRSRAARAYAAGGRPDGQDIVRVWLPRDPAELRARMSEPPLSVWSDNDVCTWYGRARRPRCSWLAGCSPGSGRSRGPMTCGRCRCGSAVWTRR